MALNSLYWTDQYKYNKNVIDFMPSEMINQIIYYYINV